MPRTFSVAAIALLTLIASPARLITAADGNRLAYLDGPLDPYYPHREFPKLTTPQWVGEEGVEAVVTLAIDDMRESAKYETFLRPILNRLKAIDGRAAVSIMSCRVKPDDPQLQAWLKEGLSIEVHTYDHPCPCLQDGGLAKAKETYEKCVDLMNEIPGNKPVAFRMPCCDSKNTPSPRFWAEVFNKTTEKGNFLQIDSSVFNIITSKDKDLPAEITQLPDGSERFRRYVPFANFVNTIEDYPYPYVIGGMCWEFPCVVPSDWSANHVQQPNNPDTVRDWKLALDAIVKKQGTFNLVFHPHGWIRSDQIVELIDHAVTKHGKKVKFLTFKECAERLNQNVLVGKSLRSVTDELKAAAALRGDSPGSETNAPSAELVDLNDDGFLDVQFSGLFRANKLFRRSWDTQKKSWADEQTPPDQPGKRPRTHNSGLLYRDMILRDVDGDGNVETITVNDDKRGGMVLVKRGVEIFGPPGVKLFDSQLKEAGLFLVDINADGKLDCLFSNHQRYCLYLFKDMKEGWSIKVFDVVRGKEDGTAPVIPPFVRADGTNNGAWFHSGALWLMNEDTWRLPDNVFKLTFAEMLAPLGEKNTSPQRKQGKSTPKLPPTAIPSLALRASGSEVRGQSWDVGEQGTECCGGGAVVEEQAAETKEQAAKQNPKSNPGAPGENPKSPSSPKSTAAGPELAGPRFDDLQMTRPLSPEESLKAMHVRPGMKVELVAAEPLVVDPVAFDWGPDGRLWVVEMRDYPNGITWNKEGDPLWAPGGRVKVLTDTDGDGRYDKAAIFLDEIPFPTGVKVWRKGILVTAAPEILYAEDKDGDDKADEKKVLYRGFGEGNQQHRVNGLRWGLDNWLYVGNGDSGGVIRSQGSGVRSQESSTSTRSVSEGQVEGREVNVAGRDLRIRPDTGELDAVSGNTQFGRERDDWGNWFGGNNSNPMWHYTLDDYYLRRNPYLTPPAVRKSVSIFPGTAPVYPKSKTIARFNDFSMANRFTSACSPIIYRDDLLGQEYYGNSFVCEPVHNLVHREIVRPQGSTFTSQRAADEQESEFLASEDTWFRPSMCRTGPDGALWIADMYRFVIEHPKWIPEAAQKILDMRAGDDKGRIYRVYPTSTKPRPIARLDKLDTAGLVAALDSPNGPQRDLAHQMLLWRDDKAAIEPLKKLAAQSKRPQTRLQALCILDGLNALPDDILVQSLTDEHPDIRRHAIRLAESRLAKNSDLAAGVLKLTADPEPLVRMQVSYALGALPQSGSAQAIANLLTVYASDPYFTAAALSSISKENVAQVLSSVVAAASNSSDAQKLVERLLTMAAAMGQEAAVGQALTAIVKPQSDGTYAAWQFTAIASAADALARRKIKAASLLDADSQRLLAELLAKARQLINSADSNTLSLAASATSLLARGLDSNDEPDIALLVSLLAPQKPPELRSAAVSALARTARSEIPKLLLAGWAAHTPSLRSQIIDALAAREDWALALLAAVESGQIPASQFDARRRQQFLNARSKAVRDRAEKALAGAVDPNRQKLVETYLAAATGTKGNPANGKLVFTKRCANCHRLEGAGFAVGPDLSPLANRTPEYLLTAMLDPNRAVEDRYLEYIVLTTDGRQINGILTEETGASLTLAAQEGKQNVISRSDVDQMRSSGKSLMPEGIEKDVTPPEMADLLAYLHTSAPPPKKLAGNEPQVVRPFVEGSIRLLATNARVYGPTIKIEETYRALGWWNSPEDYVVWSFEVPAGAGGEYRMTVDYSCADNSAGNTAVIEVAGQTYSGKVESSGGWDAYRGWNLGTVNLPDGPGELSVRSDGPIKRALFDLRSIRLTPTKR